MTKYSAETYIFSVLAILAGISAVSGVENKIFSAQADPKQLLRATRSKTENAEQLANRLRAQTVVPGTEKIFVLPTPSTESLPPTQSDTQQDYLLFSGTITLSDSSKRAIINGTSVAVGSCYRGYKIAEIKDHQVLIEKNGEKSTIELFKKCFFDPTETIQLDLSQIVEENGQWKALFQNQAYGVGDWLDSSTRIQAITPTRVLISRDGHKQTLTVSKQYKMTGSY